MLETIMNTLFKALLRLSLIAQACFATNAFSQSNKMGIIPKESFGAVVMVNYSGETAIGYQRLPVLDVKASLVGILDYPLLLNPFLIPFPR